MKATFADFIKQFPNCSKFEGNADAMLIFEFLSRDLGIIKMIDASEAGKPALTPWAIHLEHLLLDIKTPTLSFDDNFTKQAVGMMVKTILEPFGYVVRGQKNLPKSAGSTKFVSASCYRYDYLKAKPSMRIAKRVEEIERFIPSNPSPDEEAG